MSALNGNNRKQTYAVLLLIALNVLALSLYQLYLNQTQLDDTIDQTRKHVIDESINNKMALHQSPHLQQPPKAKNSSIKDKLTRSKQSNYLENKPIATTKSGTAIKNDRIQLLIIMIDNRFNFSKMYPNNVTETAFSYFYYSALINLLYAQKWNYSILFIQPIINNTKIGCNTRYVSGKISLPHISWCKVEFLSYYLNEYNDTLYDWIIYLDSDAFFTQSYTSFLSFLNTIDQNGIDMIVSVDLPYFAKLQIQQMQRRILFKKGKECSFDVKTANDTSKMANTGTLLFRHNQNSYDIVEYWAKSLNKIHFWKTHWPMEQGAFNCYIGHNGRFNNSILRLNDENRILIGPYNKQITAQTAPYVIHHASAWWKTRDHFAWYLIKERPYLSDSQYMTELLFLPAQLPHIESIKTFGKMTFIEHAYYF